MYDLFSACRSRGIDDSGVFGSFASSIKVFSRILFGFFYQSTNQPTAIHVPQKSATIGMSVISVFVLFYLLANIFWWTLFSSGFLILAHALSRDASLHKDAEDQVDMQGDLTLASGSGEDTAFLNTDATVENI